MDITTFLRPGLGCCSAPRVPREMLGIIGAGLQQIPYLGLPINPGAAAEARAGPDIRRLYQRRRRYHLAQHQLPPVVYPGGLKDGVNVDFYRVGGDSQLTANLLIAKTPPHQPHNLPLAGSQPTDDHW